MKKASKPKNEEQRLNSLKSLNLLDTFPEEEYDQITELASQICNTPIALISLVDQDRQWFKSKKGTQVSQTPRDISLCAHAILSEQVFLIEDTKKDDRFFDNPIVTGDPHIEFYAGAPLLAPDGHVIGTVCVIDNKPKKLTETQLQSLKVLSKQVTKLLEFRQNVEKLETANFELKFKTIATNSLSEGIVLQNASGEIVDFNPAALKVLDLTADQLTGKNSMDPHWRAVKEDLSDFPGSEHPAMMSLATGKEYRDVIMGIFNKDENVRWIKINATPIFFNQEKKPSFVVTSFNDVSSFLKAEKERQSLEAKLTESARLTSLGEMASGIAHEINNPLAIIKGKIHNLKTKLEKEEKIDREEFVSHLNVLNSTVDRIAKIIKGLRAFSRNAENDPFEKVVFSYVVNEAFDLSREKVKKLGIDLKVEVNENLLVECRPVQIGQVIVNLINNSIDAVSKIENKWISIVVSENKGLVRILFKDSGSGINEKVAGKMMDPFFTTKDVGKGTGLGLSISKGIIEQHNGTLQYLPSEANTCFEIIIPKNQTAVKAA